MDFFAAPGGDLCDRLRVAGGADQGAGRRARDFAGAWVHGRSRQELGREPVFRDADGVLVGLERSDARGVVLGGGRDGGGAAARVCRAADADRVICFVLVVELGGAGVFGVSVGRAAARNRVSGDFSGAGTDGGVVVPVAGVPAQLVVGGGEAAESRSDLAEFDGARFSLSHATASDG